LYEKNSAKLFDNFNANNHNVSRPALFDLVRQCRRYFHNKEEKTLQWRRRVIVTPV